MAKVFYFFPDAHDMSNSFPLDKEKNVLHTANPVLKHIFDGVNTIDKGVSDAIADTVNNGEIPVLM